MAGPYSQDLRERVIEAVVHGGMSRRGAAERFGISESVAIKWVERFERTGLRTAGKMGGHKRPRLEPHREFLEACCAEKPDVTPPLTDMPIIWPASLIPFAIVFVAVGAPRLV